MCSISASIEPVESDRAVTPEVIFANLSYVLSRGFASPLELDEQPIELLTAMQPYLEPVLGEHAVQLADAWRQALTDPQPLSLAYARLFLGPFEILAPPYASHYLEADQRIMGAVSQQVARAYVEAGLKPGQGPREAPDHVSLEWEFVHYLTHQFLATGESIWLEKRQAFFDQHMRRWMPALASGITAANLHPFYNALAALLVATLSAGIPSNEIDQ